MDNAAKLYPAVRNSRWSANFRVAAVLKEKVDPVLLQQALDIVVARFVNFRVRLRRGLFWYYLEESAQKPRVEPDVANPCTRFDKGKNKDLFRVRYYERRVAVEIFHVLSDGTGGIIFLKTLLAEYCKLRDKKTVPCLYDVADCTALPDPEEMEDAFKRFAKFKTLMGRRENTAYHFEGECAPPGYISVISGLMPVDVLIKKSKEHKVTLTEFLTGVMIFSLAKLQKASGARVERPVKVSVPVNMRRFYKSKTMRNFSLYVNPGIEPRFGEFAFEEILEEVHHFMRMNLKEKYLNAMMCKNISSEQNPVLRVVPLFIKNIAMTLAFKRYGDRLVSTTFSNLGQVKVPKEMEEDIERFEFMLGRFSTSIPNAAAVSFGNTLCLTWTSGMLQKDVEREFFTTLVKMGVPVRIESNLNYDER